MALPAQADAGGLDGDAAAAFHGQGIGMGGAGIDAAGGTDGACVGEQLFGQGGFTRVDVGEDAEIANHGGPPVGDIFSGVLYHIGGKRANGEALGLLSPDLAKGTCPFGSPFAAAPEL